jgi:predicted transcriptional regulator of viral defense system
LIYLEQSIGGYNRITSILEELSENINLAKMKEVVKNDFPLSVFQRAGFIAENILDNTKLAAVFENKLTKLNPKTVLLKSSEEKNGEKNGKWNLIINTEIESDL